MFIAAFDVETDESLLIELPSKKAKEILDEFSQDYEQLASSLQVINKRLVLLNPVSHFYYFTDSCFLSFNRNLFNKSESGLHPLWVVKTVVVKSLMRLVQVNLTQNSNKLRPSRSQNILTNL